MPPKKVIESQYKASLAMLRHAVEKCPDSLWADASYANPFWHVVYHTLFFTHLYLSPAEADFVPWEKHRDEIVSLEKPVAELTPYSKTDLLDYLAHVLEQVQTQVDVLDLEVESGFHWLPFGKLELQFYNIRHIMQHTGELCERLGAHGEVEVDWVGMGK
jgi:hypothetical protein